MRSILPKEEAETVLKAVIDSFTDEQRSNLIHNINSGIKLYCGELAYMAAGERAGDLIALSITRDFPDHKLDLKNIHTLQDKSWLIYKNIIASHTLQYYHATQTLEEIEFKDLIISHIGSTSDH